MPSYSKTSKRNLATCHPDLVVLFNYIIQYVDCSVVYGQRTPEVQFGLYKKGREFINGKWVKTGNIWTNCDGYEKKSNHNMEPLSHAADVIRYPVDWEDYERMRHFAGYVLGWAAALREAGEIEHEIVCGVDWDGDFDLDDQSFLDLPHYQIVVP